VALRSLGAAIRPSGLVAASGSPAPRRLGGEDSAVWFRGPVAKQIRRRNVARVVPDSGEGAL
jgi:hypothetical protein